MIRIGPTATQWCISLLAFGSEATRMARIDGSAWGMMHSFTVAYDRILMAICSTPGGLPQRSCGREVFFFRPRRPRRRGTDDAEWGKWRRVGGPDDAGPGVASPTGRRPSRPARARARSCRRRRSASPIARPLALGRVRCRVVQGRRDR